ncbi:MAG: hypothetical protein V2I67_05900 [Thermoanaerobaculales bacterium]|jgi:hypothetical protein|nr:hypothetical protein [Thermoanaerobaculales bacterium]
MHKATRLLCVVVGLVVVFSGATVFGETVLTDDFSGGLVNWTTGTNTGINPGGPDISVVNEEVAFSQGHDYIETNSSYGDDFEISFQVRRTVGSSQNFDFLVEVVEAPDFSGLMRFRYGIEDYYVINIGSAPSTTDPSGTGDGVDTCDPDYRQTLDRQGEDNIGTVTYTYSNGAMKFAFTQDNLGTIETPWVSTGATFSSTKIRIWAMGSGPSGDGTRLIDNVRIDAPAPGTSGSVDDFSGGLGNWIVGTNTGINPLGPDVSIVNEELAFSQAYDYIETRDSYGASFVISFQARRTTGSSQNFDFLVEVVEAPDFSGLMRFQYGLQDYYAINIGSAPSTTDPSGTGDGVDTCDPDYLQTLDRQGEDNIGTVTYTYSNGVMKFAFTQDNLGTIETPWVDTGATFSSTKIRIWAMGSGPSGAGTRLIDNVTIFGGTGDQSIFADGFETGDTIRWSVTVE